MALLVGVLTVFFCLILGDGYLVMMDNWAGRVVFCVGLVGVPWLFRKKTDVRELWMFNFVLYMVAIGLLQEHFWAISTHRLLLVGPGGHMGNILLEYVPMRSLCLCTVQSLVWALPTTLQELGRSKVSPPVPHSPAPPPESMGEGGGPGAEGERAIPMFYFITKERGYAILIGALTVFFCVYLGDGVLGTGKIPAGKVILYIAAVGIAWLFRKRTGLKELWMLDFIFYMMAIGLLSIRFGVETPQQVFLYRPASGFLGGNSFLAVFSSFKLCAVQGVVWIVPTMFHELREHWRIEK